MKLIDRLFTWAGGIATVVVFFVTFAQVICRFVIKYSLPWATDVTRIAFAISIFCGMCVGVIRHAHLNIDVLLHALPKKLQHILAIVSNVIVMIFLGTVFVWSIPFIRSNTDQFMPYLSWLPLSWVYVSIPITVFFMLLSLLIDTVKLCRPSKDAVNEKEGA